MLAHIERLVDVSSAFVDPQKLKSDGESGGGGEDEEETTRGGGGGGGKGCDKGSGEGGSISTFFQKPAYRLGE